MQHDKVFRRISSVLRTISAPEFLGSAINSGCFYPNPAVNLRGMSARERRFFMRQSGYFLAGTGYTLIVIEAVIYVKKCV
jgi:hypothetical protein